MCKNLALYRKSQNIGTNNNVLKSAHTEAKFEFFICNYFHIFCNEKQTTYLI